MTKPRKDTDLNMKNSLNCSGRLLDLSTATIMGILNLTDDSFSDGGKYNSEEKYLERTATMITEGAAIIDIGGQSTRPGAKRISADDEWARVEKPLQKLSKKFPETIFSIDTFYSSVALRAIDCGASIVNDISGGNIDNQMFSTVARLNVPYILMHMQGEPATMQVSPSYENIVIEILDYFNDRISRLKDLGQKDIILDPGFGFGKTTEHNFILLKNLNLFTMTGLPILAGLSRKSMVTKVLNVKNTESVNGTTVLNTIALLNGAKILRVHDIKEAKESINLVNQLQSV